MRWPAVLLVALAAGCQAASAPTFDIKALTAGPDTDQITLTGWFQLTNSGFRLYPGGDGKGACVSGMLLSMAGIPTPEYSNRMMTVSGYLRQAGSPEAGSAPDVCKTGFILQASDITVP